MSINSGKCEANRKVEFQMTLRISGKHMDIGDAFRTRITERIGEAIEKYFDRGFSGQVTVLKAGSRYSADCMVRLDSGASLQAAGEAQDPVQAFEAAAERLEKRLRRYKRRLKSHYPNNVGSSADAVQMAYAVMEPLTDDEEIAENFAPAVVAESSMALQTMSVASAVIELDTKDSPVFVFRNAGTSISTSSIAGRTETSAGSTPRRPSSRRDKALPHARVGSGCGGEAQGSYLWI